MSKQAPRVVVIGNSGVGKTSMIQRMATGEFDKLNAPTVGAGVTPITVKINGQDTTFHVWDTAGQETFRTIVPLYFRDAVCAVLVFSLTDSDSFDSLGEWVKLFYKTTPDDVPIVVAANKSDMDDCFVNVDDARKWADNHNSILFITSAVTGQGIPQLFEYCGTICAEHMGHVDQPQEIDKPKQGCC